MSAEATTAHTFQEQFVAFVRGFGLHRPDETPCGQPVTVAEAHALTELARYAPMSQNELAARLKLEKSTVSRLISNLGRRALVVRTRSELDGRLLEVRLTVGGQRLATGIAAARAAKLTRLLEAIPEEQRPMVMAALETLVEAMRERP